MYTGIRPIQAAIFDADGTLLDSMPLWNASGDLYLQSKGLVPEAGLDRILFQMTMEESAVYLKDHYALKESAEAVLKGLDDIVRSYYSTSVKAKPGALDLVQSLQTKGIPQIVCTLSDRDMVVEGLKRNGMLSYFDEVVSCADLPWTKRNPELFDHLITFLKTPADRTWLFEDGAYSAVTAKEVGLKVVGILDVQGEEDIQTLKSTADIFLESFYDLDLSSLGL